MKYRKSRELVVQNFKDAWDANVVGLDLEFREDGDNLPKAVFFLTLGDKELIDFCGNGRYTAIMGAQIFLVDDGKRSLAENAADSIAPHIEDKEWADLAEKIRVNTEAATLRDLGVINGKRVFNLTINITVDNYK